MPQSQCQGSSLDKPAAVATRSPSDGSTLRRAGGGGGGPVSATSSPEHSDHALSASSDSGLSNASLWTERGSAPISSTSSSTATAASTTKASGPSPQEKAELRRLLSGFGLEEPTGMFHGDATDGITAMEAIGRATGHPAQVHQHQTGGRPQLLAKERETDILDDEEVLLMSGHDLRSVDSLGTLSSSYHESSQNSLLSDGFGSPSGPEDVAAHHQHQHLNHHGHQYFQNQHQPHHHAPGGVEDYERAFGEARRVCSGQRNASVPAASSPSPCGTGPHAGSFRQGGYSTHTWVQQQQMVAAQQYSYLREEVAAETTAIPTDGYRHEGERGVSPSPEPPAGEQRNGADVVAETTVDKSRDEEFNSLTVDIDNSIDQLNQLIMDLDPTFVPLPTRTGSVKRNGGAPANGPTTACTNGITHRVSGASRAGAQQAGKVQVSPG